jgi:hypothetical protein
MDEKNKDEQIQRLRPTRSPRRRHMNAEQTDHEKSTEHPVSEETTPWIRIRSLEMLIAKLHTKFFG